VITAGRAFIQNLRHGHREPGLNLPPVLRNSATFTELARASPTAAALGGVPKNDQTGSGTRAPAWFDTAASTASLRRHR
jgi:hypothetical protein